MITNIKTNTEVSTIKDPFKSYSKEEMEKMLKELIVRFNTSPKLYEKQDFGHLIKCIIGVYTFQGADIGKIEEMLQNNGRLVNSKQLPENFNAGFSILTDSKMITYKNSNDTTSFMTYLPKEGDSFLVMDSMELYCYLNGRMQLTGTFSTKSQWLEI